MADNMQAPATKQNIAILMEQIGRFYDEMIKRMDQKTEETKRYFDVVAEDMRHDYLGPTKTASRIMKTESADWSEKPVSQRKY